MKKLLILCGVLGFALTAFVPVAKIEIGDKLPLSTAQFEDINGNKHSLKALMKTNGLLVMFTSNTCPYVIKNQARTKQIMQFATDNNVGTVLLNSNEGSRGAEDSKKDMIAYAKGQDYKWPYAIDENSAIADAFGATRTPECYLFDKNGNLVYHGAIDDSPADAKKVNRIHAQVAIEEIIANKPVSTPTTKSIGCGIKRN